MGRSRVTGYLEELSRLGWAPTPPSTSDHKG